MRKMFLLFGMLAMVGALFVACTDEQDLTSPEEAAFAKGKVSHGCTDTDILEEKGEIEDDIDIVLTRRPSKKGAYQNVDNIARKICTVPPNYEAALNTAMEFYRLVYRQPVDKLEGGLEAAADLVNRVFAFAVWGSGFPPSPIIPPEALEPTGGVGIVTPGANDTIWTNNDQAAFIALPGSFTGDDPVTVVLQRLADPPPTPGTPISNYQAFALAYDFSTNAELDGLAELWTCVVLDALPVPFEDLVLGHELGDGESELFGPPLYQDYDGQVIECAEAGYQSTEFASVPGWIQFAGTILEPVVNGVLDVKPLNAMYFGGRGLGGRGGSLSPIAPVDKNSGPPPDPILEFTNVELNVPVAGDEILYLDYYWFTISNWWAYPDELFVQQSEFTCGGAPSSRTHLDIRDFSDNSYIYGFCQFDSPDDLQSFWFAVPAGEPPPAAVYIELVDNIGEEIYVSNSASTAVSAGYNLVLSVTGPGSVGVSGQDLSCTSTVGTTTVCRYWFSRLGGPLVLDATPDVGYSYGTWTGCSAPARETCSVTPESTMNVSATFVIDTPS